ncbi:hypothetical protein I8748_04425 [Nostoc sp. CENA67]|uniref:Uncharacterized protein n=1 Tax=Amazonocrinis nigriterrae CENA67 TaxID=2794033 RepID=A0A8J7HKU8_9NOST|nr:hypothetical protein [Amazonocrinis nigriterrae]MBH8561431.1 hypothetical protein [Amazonocrinis nigriterrae CENA67]
MFDPIEYADERMDLKQENELVKWLRQLEEEQKFTFVWRVLNANTWKGCQLTKRSQLKPIFLEVILEKGLVYGDASTVEWWIKAVLQGLGHKRVLEIIKAHMDIAPLCVYKTLYWLPWLYRNQSKKLKNEILALQVEFNQKYPNYQPRRSIGTHA